MPLFQIYESSESYKNLKIWKSIYCAVSNMDRGDLISEPFTSQCRKMVRHTLKILQHLLQDF